MIDKVQKIKDWINKEQAGLMDANGNFEYPEYEGAYHILCNLYAFIDSLQEEPVSKELEKEIDNYLPTVFSKDMDNREPRFTTYFKALQKTAIHFTKWQKEQFEKNRLAACDRQTKEEAEIESDFCMGIIEKEHRQPTFDDAIKYGMRLQKEQLMAEVIDARCFGFQGDALFSFRLPADNYLVGSEVKVIMIKDIEL